MNRDDRRKGRMCPANPLPDLAPPVVFGPLPQHQFRALCRSRREQRQSQGLAVLPSNRPL